MKMMRLVALAVPIAFVLLNFATPAAATKPDVTVDVYFNYEATYVDCGSFVVNARADGFIKATTHFDNEGNPILIAIHAQWDGIAWNSVSGFTVRDDERLYVTYDLVTGVNTLSGPIVHWVIPGRGSVLMEGGHSVVYTNPDGTMYSIAHGHPHDLSPGGNWMDFTPMCAVLA